MNGLQREGLAWLAAAFCNDSQTNYIQPEEALRPELAGMRIYGEPLLAVAEANDPLFEQLRRPEAIGPHFALPGEWLEGAHSVVSFFLPFTGQVVGANRADPERPADEWLHGRYEGQRVLVALAEHLHDAIGDAGFPCAIPMTDPRFWSLGAPDDAGRSYTCNWSERHVAYVCGLGTFGLSGGLITRAGMAGRFGSIVTALPLEPDKRAYTRYNQYCTLCGACVRRCPVGAISLETGKSHPLCDRFLDGIRADNRPRYGCGKCQTRVPCESRIPAAAHAV